MSWIEAYLLENTKVSRGGVQLGPGEVCRVRAQFFHASEQGLVVGVWYRFGRRRDKRGVTLKVLT
jgi:hypothetical protein